jgi:formylglycine-generating enzyme required for sulfatase activity
MRSGKGRYMGPQRTVRIARDFALGQTEVTNAQFAVFAAENPDIDAAGCSAWGGREQNLGLVLEKPRAGETASRR